MSVLPEAMRGAVMRGAVARRAVASGAVARAAALACLWAAFSATPAGAGELPAEPRQSQTPTAGPGASMQPGSELRVYLLTMGPGDAIWEKFGHNALWIRDDRAGTDVAYNWGMFDFTSEDFVPRFLQGSMLYWMEAFPLSPMVDAYVSANRSVWAQELALTPDEKHALREFVTWNALEENKYYTYDYYRDNCSTRVRDALDRVLGGYLRGMTDTIPTGTTWRSHTRRLTQDAQPWYTGIDIMLGQPVDRPISAWEEMFLPMRLRERVRDVRVPGEDGARRPLVVSEMQLFAATREPEPARAANLLGVYLAIGLVLAALLGGLARAAERGRLRARLAFAAVGTLWSVLAGIAGTLMLLTWLFTDHVVAHANENLLQYSPLSLVLAAMLPLAVLRSHEAAARGPGGTTARLAIAIAGLAAAGFVLQPLPMFDQVNGQAIALALPAHLALAWGTWALSARPRSRRTQSSIVPPSPARHEPGSAASAPAGSRS